MITDYNLQILIEPLLNWFAGHARVLPWREEPTPYRVWVSEIMLQQTRVEAVKPYFERFTKRLPDVEALAECPEDELLNSGGIRLLQPRAEYAEGSRSGDGRIWWKTSGRL